MAIINRRIFFKVAATGVAGYMASPMELFPQEYTAPPATVLSTAKNVVFVHLQGAMSHVDTLDLKVGAWTPATFAPTTINGADWPLGLLPTLGDQFARNRFSIVRSCRSAALVHQLLQTWNQTGRNPASATGKIAPNYGTIVALEAEAQRRSNQPLPGFVSLNGGNGTVGSGYLPGKFAPFGVTPAQGGIANLAHPDGESVFNTRYNMLSLADEGVAYNSPYGKKFEEMADFYSAARTMMYNPTVTNAFRFTAADQTRYGNTAFGNACVTARNVLAADLGARFIQINLGGWDNHTNIYNAILNPARALDIGLGTLMEDLSTMPGSKGTLLDDTLIVAKGEFGRTVGPLTAQQGRDHWATHATLFGGGGVRGGAIIGSTDSVGRYVDSPGWSLDREVFSEDVAATLYSALGINYRTVRDDDPLGRGFEYVASTGTPYVGEPILELFR